MPLSRLLEGAVADSSRPKVTLPKPVGDTVSGTTRLSELRSRRNQPEQPVASGSASKFFQPKSRRSTVAQKAESVHVDLVLDDESPLNQENEDEGILDAQPSVIGSPATGSTGMSVPPSPFCSTIFSSPVKAESERAGSLVSSPGGSDDQGDDKRSIGGFTSPFGKNQDDFDRLEVQPPTPSPSLPEEARNLAIIAPQTPQTLETPQDAEGEQRSTEVKQEPKVEIDLSHFYAKEELVASPISLLSDLESDVEDTQRETAEQVKAREERQKQEVKAVAAGWKAKYTFAGAVSWRMLCIR